MLLKQKKIAADYAVPCDVRPADGPTLTEASLTENVTRDAMHPADEFEAFKKLADDGRGAETIAAHFGVTPRVVERRLKLAVVSPKLIAIFRKDGMTLEQLMAFTLSENHNAQEKVWRDLPQWAKERGDGRQIRDQITEAHISADNALAKFVTVAVYKEAGGAVVRDLFDDEDAGYLTDAALLQRLAAEKLEGLAEGVRPEGWKWVEVKPEFGFDEAHKFGRVTPTLTNEQKGDIAKLVEQQGELGEDGDEDAYDKLQEQIDAIEATAAFTRAQQAQAGVVITIGHNGEAQIKRGMVKPEDVKAAKKIEGANGKAAKNGAADGGQVEETEISGLSASLVEDLTAHRTAALQAKLAGSPKIALVAGVHALTVSCILDSVGYHPAVKVKGIVPDLERSAGDGIKTSPARKEFNAATREATKGMPKEAAKLWDWLMKQDQHRLLQILAVCAASTVYAVDKKHGMMEYDTGHADQLATALKLNMADYWESKADNYLGRVSKDLILAAVEEACGEG